MRTVVWDDAGMNLQLIDQRLLPGEFRYIQIQDHNKAVWAIREMVVRGAPAIGATAAFGLAMAGLQSKAEDRRQLLADLASAAEDLIAARPTAVNLAWAVNRLLDFTARQDLNLLDLRIAILEEAERIADEDVEINRNIALHGAELINDGDTVIHHCNTGALATVDWGTALGVIRMAHEMGKRVHVLVDETRPRLQGARLTAWELDRYGIPYEIISDNAAGYFLSSGQAQKVIFGADRVAANGDVANKIGTYMLALAAHDNEVPVYAAVPTSTIDLNLASGLDIPIEERSAEEVLNLEIDGNPVVPNGAAARNPAFDITPHRLVSAIITEHEIVKPPYIRNLERVVRSGSPG